MCGRFLHKRSGITDNICVENFIVYGCTALFAAALLPVYVSVYAFADSSEKFASTNFCVYRFIRFLNVNTEEGGAVKVNGKDMKINPLIAARDAKVAFDNLCVFKIIQLSDFGLLNQANAYAALGQSAVTFPLYSYIAKRGSSCKLKNYVILNFEHGDIFYTAKVVSVLNIVTALKIIFLLLRERTDEN